MVDKIQKRLTIGAVCESSNGLSNAVGSQVPLCHDFIVEFGAGCGALTKNLPHHTISYELCQNRYEKLKKRFPARSIRQDNAIFVLENLEKKAYIVNSIPTVLNPVAKKLKSAIKKAYHKDMIEKMVVYTYFPINPYKGIFKQSKIQAIVFGNLPPAYVWTYA